MLHTYEKHVHDRIISLKGGYAPKSGLTSSLFNVLLECLYQELDSSYMSYKTLEKTAGAIKNEQFIDSDNTVHNTEKNTTEHT